MLVCDLCGDKYARELFFYQMYCGNHYCGVCKYLNRDYIRKKICLVCK